MLRLCVFTLVLLLATWPARADPPRIVGYVAAFKGLDRELAQPRLDHYTHLVLAFVNPTPTGAVLAEGGLACAPAGAGTMISYSQLQSLIAWAHSRQIKVLASLGGAVIPPCGGDWATLLQPETRQTLVANLVGFVDRYDLDGLDVDLEGDLMIGIDRNGNFTPFVRELAAALHARSKLLTAATGSSPSNMIPASSLAFFDLIGIMSYDAVGRTWGTPGGEHASYDQAENELAMWIKQGVPAAKLLLGLPFYGRGFGTYQEGWSLQDIASQLGKKQVKSDVVGQRCGGCDYITYNGLPTLARKAELAGAWGAGIMVWEVGQDLPDGAAIHRIVRAYAKGRTRAARRAANDRG